jgi:putative ABC transport system permease protein
MPARGVTRSRPCGARAGPVRGSRTENLLLQIRPLAVAAAWYRLGATLRRDRVGYLAIALIVGIIGGVAVGSVAAARRTQSAFPRILAASNPSNLDVDPGVYNPQVLRRIRGLPGVESDKEYVALYGLRALPSGFADPRTLFNQQVELVGSLNGLYFSQDRVIITSGRRANPRRPGEVVISEQTAARFGLHVGQSTTINLYSGRGAGPAAGRDRQR